MLRLHKLAEEEIREAAQWYEERAEGLGRRFIFAIRDALQALEENPERHAKLETLSTDLPFQRVFVRGFPYLIVFEPVDGDVFVYAVAHASRRLNYWRRRKRTNPGE